MPTSSSRQKPELYIVLWKTPSISRALTVQIKSQVPLAGLTSFRVGGPAEWFIAPRSTEELQASLEWAQSQNLPITFLGAGSNLLVSDHGLPGLVICTRRLRQTRFDLETGQVTAAAGEPLATLGWKAAKRGWKGMEWAVGIPGTVGGAVVMNAGAHGLSTADILVQADVLNSDQTMAILAPEDLGYQYRTSRIAARAATSDAGYFPTPTWGHSGASDGRYVQ